MSSNIWTASALSSEAKTLSGSFWRVVEAQHAASTMKLTDSLDEQIILENLIEETKPPIPPGCENLHFLLMTPFRYSTQNPRGSRFRKPNSETGAFYASERPETAIAEATFHRLMFFADSPATPWPQNAGEYTAFAVELYSKRAIDLMLLPTGDVMDILDPVNYAAGQSFADTARRAGIEIIKYPSVRDPNHGANLAVLTPASFVKTDPIDHQTWRLHLDRNGARAICDFPRSSIAFGRDAFSVDPRMTEYVWDR